MNKYTSHFLGITLLFSSVTGSCSKNKLKEGIGNTQNTANSPNIILILADDMGWADSNPYGSTYYETPNLSRLSREGMLFTDAYAASPLCSPTRASIMSGQYPARLHLTVAITPPDVFEPKALPPAPNQYCGDVQNKNHMPLEVFTLAEALKESGYKTAHIGKWHLSVPGGDERFDAKHQGFDFVIGGDHLPGPPDYYSPYKNNIRNLAPGTEGEYLNERLAEETIRWIKSVRDSGKPFYLNFWHYAVHTPIIAKKDLLPKYRAKTDPQGLQNCPEMATMIESMDHSIGILLDWLDLPENHLLKKNTVILFTSDNGGVVHEVAVDNIQKQVTSNRPLRGGKANTYEGGIREPWIVRWPDHIQAGVVCHTPVSTVDIYPTVLELAGVKPKAGYIMDGRSIMPLLKGASMEERPLFFDFPHHFGILCASSTTVRLGDYKLLRFYWAGDHAESHYYELYDLKRDPSEAINLAAYMPGKVKELDALIERHLQETGALVSIRNTAFSGNPRAPRSSLANAPNRPLSISLPQTELVIGQDEGSREFQLLDQKDNPCKTTALLLEGGEWVRVKNRADGRVEVLWDRTLKTGPAKVLFGWSGGVSVFEMNDWTLDPFELGIR
ncbi:MAG: sulfatase [Bacteroidota bacterium]|nr:sulfatase [Bacteroidota bacterium]